MKILGLLAKGLGEGKKSNEEAHWLRQERLKKVIKQKSKFLMKSVSWPLKIKSLKYLFFSLGTNTRLVIGKSNPRKDSYS